MLLVVLDGLAGVAQIRVGHAQVAQHGAFAPSVPDLASDGQCLLVVLDGLAGVAQVGVGAAQVAQRITFAPSVPDLAGDGQRCS